MGQNRPFYIHIATGSWFTLHNTQQTVVSVSCSTAPDVVCPLAGFCTCYSSFDTLVKIFCSFFLSLFFSIKNEMCKGRDFLNLISTKKTIKQYGQCKYNTTQCVCVHIVVIDIQHSLPFVKLSYICQSTLFLL